MKEVMQIAKVQDKYFVAIPKAMLPKGCPTNGIFSISDDTVKKVYLTNGSIIMDWRVDDLEVVTDLNLEVCESSVVHFVWALNRYIKERPIQSIAERDNINYFRKFRRTTPYA